MVTICRPTWQARRDGGIEGTSPHFPGTRGWTYIRVRNKTLEERTTLEEKLANGWMYCPKSEWKKNVRDRKKGE